MGILLIAKDKAFLRPACPFPRLARWLQGRLGSQEPFLLVLALPKATLSEICQYARISTTLGFADVLLAGLAEDGGLYVPDAWPKLAPDLIAGFAGRPYSEVAHDVIAPFVGADIAGPTSGGCAREALREFRHRATAPLIQIGPGEWVLELFHGPTLAFKDLAMQLLARLMDHVLSRA